jgi:UTP-glucose-1-phosphate uridylyltransferase/mevalonate kinase
MKREFLELFVPGRLCLFGEHSDWAGAQRAFNADIVPGEAIVTGIEQGIYATVRKHNSFILVSAVEGEEKERLECPMSTSDLKQIARDGGFYSYVAGVASYVNENYAVGGLEICITERTLPMKRGLSSSAAICVLVAKAFNRLYNLNLSTKGEMQVAYFGEQRTPSRCGRLDQACAFGVRPVYMQFDGNEMEASSLTSKSELYFVFADLMAKKDTVKILADLNRSFPYPQTALDRKLHEALGQNNHDIVSQAAVLIEEGNAPELGALMTRAQRLFDEKVAPASPEELTAPVLHSVLADPVALDLTFGGKGVGSQGDGTVQFIAKDKDCQIKLMAYLKNERQMDAYQLTLKPQHIVKKAIIPVAGYGTRMYPATKIIKKEFFPVIDRDGLAKPVILMLLEELEKAGIEEICLVINGAEDEHQYRKFFYEPLPDEHLEKLTPEIRQYEQIIRRIGNKIEYVVQNDKRGFGHAVYLCRQFTAGKPVLLLLGDTIYRTENEKNCTEQLLEAYDKTKKNTLSIHKIEIEDVINYGLVTGKWLDQDPDERMMEVQKIVEKPSEEYAKEFLQVPSEPGKFAYYAVFGEYVLTPEVFTVLGKNIEDNITMNGEIQLTDALDEIRQELGLNGYVVDGRMFDVGIPRVYAESIAEFGKP